MDVHWTYILRGECTEEEGEGGRRERDGRTQKERKEMREKEGSTEKDMEEKIPNENMKKYRKYIKHSLDSYIVILIHQP